MEYYVLYLSRLFGTKVSSAVCFLLVPTGVGAIACTVIINIASAVIFQMAAEDGIDAVAEWAKTPKFNLFDDLIFKVIEP